MIHNMPESIYNTKNVGILRFSIKNVDKKLLNLISYKKTIIINISLTNYYLKNIYIYIYIYIG